MNGEHYADPTADVAIARADRELARKRREEQWQKNGRKGSMIQKHGFGAGKRYSSGNTDSVRGAKRRDS